jgi:hypothetical protein
MNLENDPASQVAPDTRPSLDAPEQSLAPPILTEPTSQPLVPAEPAATPGLATNEGLPDLTVSFTAADIAGFVVAHRVAGMSGDVEIDLGPDGVTIVASSGDLDFSWPTAATLSGSAQGHITRLYLSAQHMGSIARWALKENAGSEAPVGLDILAYPHLGAVRVRNNASVLNGGHSLSVGLFALDDVPLEEIDRRMRTEQNGYRLDASFTVERHSATSTPPAIVRLLPRHAFEQALKTAFPLIPSHNDNPDLQLLELRDGLLYGGGLWMVFWLTVPALRTMQLRLTREQAETLLAVLSHDGPGTEYEWGTTDTQFVLIRTKPLAAGNNRPASIRATISTRAHPLPITDIAQDCPPMGLYLEAKRFRHQLADLHVGPGKCLGAWVNAWLVTKPNVGIQLRSHRPRDGEELVTTGTLTGLPTGSLPDFNWITPLDLLDTAAAAFNHRVTLSCGDNNVYLSGDVGNWPHQFDVTISVHVIAAVSVGRLARQIRDEARRHLAVAGQRRLSAPRKRLALPSPDHSSS